MTRIIEFRRAACALVIAAAACAEPEQPEVVVEPQVSSASELYDADHVPRFHLTLTEQAIELLREEPLDYVPGTFQYGDLVLDSVGVRLKGWGSFREFDDKAAFKIKFNKYRSWQRLFGLKSVTLNNMVQDRSRVHEYVGYRVAEVMGVVAPRAGFVELTINGDNYGLYANIESVDDVFLADRFDDPSGPLYEGTIWDDVVEGAIDSFELCEGDDPGRAQLTSFVQTVASDRQFLLHDPDSPLDKDPFMAFATWEMLVGQYDGYTIAHNYRLYFEPARDKWTMIPWGIDQTFVRDIDIFRGGGTLYDKCLNDPLCLMQYIDRIDQASDAFAELDVDTLIGRTAAMIDEAAARDPRTPHDQDRAARARDNMKTFIAERGPHISAMSACYRDGSKPLDSDGDGDVDGQRPVCPCTAEIIDGAAFHLCLFRFEAFHGRDWCQALGLDLATIDTPEQNRALWDAAQAVDPGPWYIGLRRKAGEKPFLWMIDDSAPAFDGWESQPGPDKNPNDGDTCVELVGCGWRAVHCGQRRAFICR